MSDGSVAPASGPVDVVVEQNLIVEISTVGTPGIPIDPKSRPQLIDKENFKVREIHAQGKYLLPGFGDSHTHIHSPRYGLKVSEDYSF